MSVHPSHRQVHGWVRRRPQASWGCRGVQEAGAVALRGWRSTVGNLIELLGLRKANHRPHFTGIIRVKRRGVRIHRIRDFKQHSFSSIPPNLLVTGCQGLSPACPTLHRRGWKQHGPEDPPSGALLGRRDPAASPQGGDACAVPAALQRLGRRPGPVGQPGFREAPHARRGRRLRGAFLARGWSHPVQHPEAVGSIRRDRTSGRRAVHSAASGVRILDKKEWCGKG